MAPRKDLFDLDALDAEADDDVPFEFKFGGEKFSLPPRPDLRAIAAMSEGRLADALRMLLGEEQVKRLDEIDAVFDDRKFLALMEAYAQHAGVGDLGNSRPSSGSSKSTARKSKPTLRGSTRSR